MVKITRMKEKLYKGVLEFAAEKAIKITDKSFSKCALLSFYEPKLPEELLNEIKNK